jgi:hypothetical protein
MDLTWVARVVAKCLGAHFWEDGRRTPYGLRDIQYGGDNLQVPIFEGKLNKMHYPQHSISLARGDGPGLHQPSLHVGPEQEHGLDEVRFEASAQSVMRGFIAENSRSTLTCVTGSAARTSLQGFAASTYCAQSARDCWTWLAFWERSNIT